MHILRCFLFRLLFAFFFRLLNRDMRIRNPPQAAVDRMLANPATRSALERANADMAAAASKVIFEISPTCIRRNTINPFETSTQSKVIC